MEPKLPNRIDQFPNSPVENGSNSSWESMSNGVPAERVGSFSTAERGDSDSKIAQAQPLAPQPVPVVVQPNSNVQAIDKPQSDKNPESAADEDLIEKEWVDRAKAIISETYGDPREREKRISALRRDYIEKRYGKRIEQ